ncbi:MAG: hypothetical protein PVS2B2_25300 [Candidatus Acidiferrum sp.]
MRLPDLIMSPGFRNKSVFLIGSLIFIAAAVFKISDFIVNGDWVGLFFVGMICAGGVAVIAILKNWRNGLYFFLGWLMFEDLARKYLGNNMAIYFGKDILVAVVYLSYFLAYRRKEVRSFRPPFFIPLIIFFWFGAIQVFNFASTSFFFGVLGMKIYFYYMPLMLIGYSLAETEEDVRRFFKFSLMIAIIIASLGITQAVIGRSFLNPEVLQEDIRALSENYRMAPLSGAILYRPNSVFVSAGRFSFYLFPAWLLSLGFCGYLFLRGHSRGARILAILALAGCLLGAVMTGSRGSIMWTMISAIISAIAFLWGAPWRQGEVLRVVRSLLRVVVAGTLVIALMIAIYPEAIASRFAFYSETLDPSSSASELVYRSRDYPLKNFLYAFDYPRWQYGYGIGTASLGIQYIARILKVPPMGIGVESGYGGLVLELGIVGLILWLIMTTAIVVSAFRIVLKLRGTAWFPVGFVIMWFAFVLLFPETFGGLQTYQDYVLNAHLWLLLGILFRLPDIALSDQFNINSANSRTAPRWAR